MVVDKNLECVEKNLECILFKELVGKDINRKEITPWNKKLNV